MPTQLQNSKKTLCCTGFTVQTVAKNDDVKGFLTDNFMNAAIAFIAAAATICGESIPNPLPLNPNNKCKVLVTCGTISDAMGRLIGGSFALPSQSIIDALTNAEEAIVAAG